MADVVWGRCDRCGSETFKNWITGETDPSHVCHPTPTGGKQIRRRPYKPPAGRVVVHHGTHSAFRPDIEAHGLVPPPGHGPGTRVTLDPATALIHARAWCCYLMMERQLPPQGMIAYALLEVSRIVEQGGRFTVPKGIQAAELRYDEKRLDECFNPAIAQASLAVFEQMTEHRTGSGIVVPRDVR